MNRKLRGLRKVLPKFYSTSVVVLSGRKRSGGRRSRKRFDGARKSARWRRLYLEV